MHRLLALNLIVFLFTVLFSPLSVRASEPFFEDFSKGINNQGFPKGWKLKQWFGNTRTIEIHTEDENRVLYLKSQKESFGIYKDHDFDAQATPFITWRWKVTRIPTGGDVREKKKDDQAAQLYVMFPRFPKMLNTRMVGYIWESGAPKGATLTSRKSSNTRYVVLQSGEEHLGKWVTEKRNIYKDYRALFNEEPPKGGGITIMIDSDDTGTSAESYFDDITIGNEPFRALGLGSP
ncbi:MAG: DUF3047 domain-containing protein [Nitrospiria bacterium]